MTTTDGARGSAMMKVGVIGCGPAGLAAIKELKAAGFDPIAFDAQDRLGGVWAWGWESIVMTSSSVHTAFSDFPASCAPKMWTKQEYHAYLEEYCREFGLHKHMHLSTKVLSAKRKRKDDGSWEWFLQTDGPAGVETWCVGSIFVATGTNSTPTRPTYPGQDTFTGDVLHSREFRSGADYSGQAVLLQGMGESGSDISHEVSQFASQTYISIRNTAGWVVPRLRKGIPADLVTNRILWGLPRIMGPYLSRAMALGDSTVDDDKVINAMGNYNFKVLEKGSNGRGVYGTFGTKNESFVRAMVEHGAKLKPDISRLGPGRKVIFSDGTEAEIDTIIQNTGFGYSFSVIDSEDDEVLTRALKESSDVRNLWKKCIHPELGSSVCFVGFARPAFGSQPPMAEMQVRLCVEILKAETVRLPERDVMDLQIKIDRQRCESQYGSDQRVTSLDDYVIYMNSVASFLGCHPGSLASLAMTKPKLAWNLLVGPHIGCQFRLTGPGASPDLAEDTMKRFTLQVGKLRKIRLFLIAVVLWLFCLFVSFLPFEGAKVFRPVGGKTDIHTKDAGELQRELKWRTKKDLAKN